jgi:UDP-GlcNAc:undecaprenyl-phosphate GlcNAc-1-phosphate transferase
MNVELYFFPFIKSFVISIFLAAVFVWLSKKSAHRFQKNGRLINSRGVSRLGGIAIILAFLVSILSDKNIFISPQLWAVIFSSVAILFFGIWDDIKNLSWKIQLAFQIAVAIFIFLMGLRIEYFANFLNNQLVFLNQHAWLSFLSFLIVTIWILIVVNSINWLDGIDGLSGGVAFIATLVIFFLILKPEVNQPAMGIMTMTVSGAILGFLIFNFHPAKILAGTAGSFFMGFMLAFMAIFAGTKIATTLLIAAIPVFDFIWVIGERFKAKRSIFESDTSHLHHKLSKLGWSPKKIAGFLYLITILISIVALNTRAIGKIITIILILFILYAFSFFINKKLQSKNC